MRLRRQFFLVLIITLAGFLIRSYKITTSPEGLYIDETSIGYNAYSIIRTAHDEHGKFMPLFFEAFGEYKLPVYIYLVALTQLTIGPLDLSVRIPSLLFGTLSVPMIYLFTKELTKNLRISVLRKYTPVLSSFLLSVSPWHFQFSRAGFEASVGLFFFLFALYLFFRGINTRSINFVCLSFVSFVLTLYTYHSARIVTPITMVTLFLLHFKGFDTKLWIKAIIVPIILTVPFVNFALSSAGLARARQVSIFFEGNGLMSDVFSNYLKNISPIYLFKNGDPTIGHLTQYRTSLLYLVEAPFFFFGLFKLIFSKSKAGLFVVVLFFISLIPPSLANLNPHALRGMFALSASPIISAVGLAYFLNFFEKKYIRWAAVLIFVAMILISAGSFLNTYHNRYVPSVGWDWQVGIKRASQHILQIESDYDDIYFEVDPRTVPLAWYLKIDPKLYQTVSNTNQLGKFHINDNIATSHGLYIGLQVPPGRLIQYIYYPDNSIAYGIWEF